VLYCVAPMMNERTMWIELNMLSSLTPRRLQLVAETLGGPSAILTGSTDQLAAVLGKDAALRLDAERRKADPMKEIKRAELEGVGIVTLADPEYPQALRETPTPPLALYIKGKRHPADSAGVAIVGTRRCTSYGRLVARKLATELAERGVTVISGMAPGVDTAAHQGALAAGRTVAVLGTGLGKPYPAGSESMMERIAARGAVISEYPWDTPGASWTFPRRNRLIAGLARAVVVIEAPSRSGALITVERALEQGKEVCAVPGPITSEASAGSNRLLQEGARLVVSVEDILEELGGVGKQFQQPPLPLLTDGAQAVYDVLGQEMLDTSQLVDHTGLSHAEVAQALVELQLAGLVEEQPGRRYARL